MVSAASGSARASPSGASEGSAARGSVRTAAIPPDSRASAASAARQIVTGMKKICTCDGHERPE